MFLIQWPWYGPTLNFNILLGSSDRRICTTGSGISLRREHLTITPVMQQAAAEVEWGVLRTGARATSGGAVEGRPALGEYRGGPAPGPVPSSRRGRALGLRSADPCP